MGGSMGAVVGEKVTRAAEAALDERMPLIVVSASRRGADAGGHAGPHAAGQDGRAHSSACGPAGVPFMSVMSDPTTGGVFASYAVLGDVNLAEPNALIGFAGARVAAGTIAQELPPGFQRAEFLFEHGFVDRVVPRAELRSELALLLRYLVPASLAVPGEATDALSLPAFRPRSFLSALADRVIPEADTDGSGRRPVRPVDVPPPADAATSVPTERRRG